MKNINLTYWLIAALGFTILLNISSYGQSNAGRFKLEITRAKIGVNLGPYRGRTPTTDGFFDQGIAGFGQVYFPFQWSVDYAKNFTDSLPFNNEYNNRLFLIRPVVVFHLVDNQSMAFGLGSQFSFLIAKQVYLEYQLSGVYVEANKAGLPDLNDGFNLHHVVSLSHPLSRHFSISGGIIHLSGAEIGNGAISNQDVITLGIKWNL